MILSFIVLCTTSFVLWKQILWWYRTRRTTQCLFRMTDCFRNELLQVCSAVAVSCPIDCRWLCRRYSHVFYDQSSHHRWRIVHFSCNVQYWCSIQIWLDVSRCLWSDDVRGPLHMSDVRVSEHGVNGLAGARNKQCCRNAEERDISRAHHPTTATHLKRQAKTIWGTPDLCVKERQREHHVMSWCYRLTAPCLGLIVSITWICLVWWSHFWE